MRLARAGYRGGVSDTSAPVTCGCSHPEVDTSWRGRLERLPRGVTAAAVIVPLLLGLVIGAHWTGATLAAIGLLAFAVVIAATWPRIGLVERALRIAVFVLLAGLAIVRVLPH